MAFDKLVDSAQLDGALTATAGAIRAKTGGVSKIAWNETTGFSDAITTQNKSVTPKASSQIIKPDAGYIGLGQVTVNGDSDLKAANIAKGVNIFGVTGTLESGSKVATGSFYSSSPSTYTVSGLGFKPTKVIVFLAQSVSNEDARNALGDETPICVTYGFGETGNGGAATTYTNAARSYWYDEEDPDTGETYECCATELCLFSGANTITPTNDGFTIKDSYNRWQPFKYVYVAIG